MDLMQIRRRMLGKRTSIIPSIYQEVEYIESTGEQYIFVDGHPTIDGTFEVDGKILPMSTGTGYPRLWGYTYGNSFSGFGHCTGRFNSSIPTNSNSYFKFGNGGEKNIGMPTFVRSRQITKKDGAYLLTLDGYEKIIDFNNVSGNDFESDYVCAIFGSIDIANSRIINQSAGRVYYFSYKDGDVAIHDMFPVYRKSDGEIGLYDTVTGKFYTNEGTGTFLKGADV